MPMMMPDGTPIPDDENNPRRPFPGGGPVGVQTPSRQPSIPITGGGAPQPSIPITDASQRPPISGGPVGVQTQPGPVHSEAWYYPQNVRARAQREQGAQAPVQTPNTAQLAPGPQTGLQVPFPGKGQILNGGYGRMYPQQGMQPDPRVIAQRRYFRGNQQPQF